MARVGRNVITQGLQGRVDNIVFRKRGKKTTAYALSPRKAPLSEKQKEAQLAFSEAVNLAVNAMKDPEEKKKFGKMARAMKKESAYGAAISYFMKLKIKNEE